MFVDDAVQGHLPMVCIRTGVPADGLHRIEQGQGPSPLAFLLIFFGPIGWIALMVMSGQTSFLTVRIPKSYAAVSFDRGLRRVRMIGVVIALVGGGVAIALRDEQMLLPIALALAVGGGVLAGAYWIRVWINRVGIELDASGRWVTLRGVHPNFAAAVAERAPRATADRL